MNWLHFRNQKIFLSFYLNLTSLLQKSKWCPHNQHPFKEILELATIKSFGLYEIHSFDDNLSLSIFKAFALKLVPLFFYQPLPSVIISYTRYFYCFIHIKTFIWDTILLQFIIILKLFRLIQRSVILPWWSLLEKQ